MGKGTPSEVTQVYGRRLRAARLSAGVTQAAIAELLDCQQSFVSKVEHGVGMFRPFDYPLIAELLGVPVLDLIGPFTEDEEAWIEEYRARAFVEED